MRHEALDADDTGGAPDVMGHWAGGASQRATRAVVDLDAIRANAEALRTIVGPDTRLMAVVKGDGYGHGAVAVARAALEGGATWLGVACVDEGIVLRNAGLRAPILVLGPIAAAECSAAVDEDLTVALSSREMALELSRAARAGREATARVHVELETGMNRHGVQAADLPELLEVLRRLPGIQVEGLYTHLACADDPTDPTNGTQLSALLAARERIARQGFTHVLVHAANSAATLYLPDTHLDMVRAGIALYGYPPMREDGRSATRPPLRPALTWRTEIARRWTLQPGESVSYGHTYRAERITQAALLPVGYGDGLPRVLSGRNAPVLVRGQRVPIIGRICMDQTIVDVSTCPEATVGDEVIVIGRQGEEYIGADELGTLAGTISYEVLSGLMPRVPRRYCSTLDGQPAHAAVMHSTVSRHD